ncbi:MAG: BON domain-containing protein [Deltaproteobacteria bacterium]|nr:BON domain-containing protein [Deltaproteobacteria bacterium]
MKKRTRGIHFLALFMLIAALAACASLVRHENPAEYVDDSVITASIKSHLAEDDFLKLVEISVETDRGVVQLGGSVDSQEAVEKADQITRSVNGVKSVKNNLIVK